MRSYPPGWLEHSVDIKFSERLPSLCGLAQIGDGNCASKVKLSKRKSVYYWYKYQVGPIAYRHIGRFDEDCLLYPRDAAPPQTQSACHHGSGSNKNKTRPIGPAQIGNYNSNVMVFGLTLLLATVLMAAWYSLGVNWLCYDRVFKFNYYRAFSLVSFDDMIGSKSKFTRACGNGWRCCSIGRIKSTLMPQCPLHPPDTECRFAARSEIDSFCWLRSEFTTCMQASQFHVSCLK